MRRRLKNGITTSTGFGLSAFSTDELDSIHYATLQTLGQTGIKVMNESAMELFYSAGAVVQRFDGHAIVKIPPHVVEDAIRVTPGTGIYHGRNPEDTFVAEPNRVGFTTFGACPNVIDPFTREVRQGTLEDTAGFARVCDYLDEIAVAERSVLAPDVPDGMMFVLSIKEMLANTGKHIFLGADSARSLQVMTELAVVCAGGKEYFVKQPIFTPLVCPASPLMLSDVVCQVTMEAARMGLGVTIIPMGLSGGTSPATLAGTVVTHNAEVLGTIVLAQLANRGTPCIYASTTSILDLRLGTAAVGAPEYGMINAAIAKLAQYYHLPCWIGAGASDSKVPDIQSGYESTLSATLGALSGANFLFGCGVLEQGLTMDYAKLLMDAEMIRMVQTAVKGVPVSDETLALDIIHDVGPGGSYIAHQHTYQHMREQSGTKLFDRRSREDWLTVTGGKSIQEKAYAAAIDILKNHRPMPLPEGAAEDMEKIVKNYEKELKTDKKSQFV